MLPGGFRTFSLQQPQSFRLVRMSGMSALKTATSLVGDHREPARLVTGPFSVDLTSAMRLTLKKCEHKLSFGVEIQMMRAFWGIC